MVRKPLSARLEIDEFVGWPPGPEEAFHLWRTLSEAVGHRVTHKDLESQMVLYTLLCQ